MVTMQWIPAVALIISTSMRPVPPVQHQGLYDAYLKTSGTPAPVSINANDTLRTQLGDQLLMQSYRQVCQRLGSQQVLMTGEPLSDNFLVPEFLRLQQPMPTPQSTRIVEARGTNQPYQVTATRNWLDPSFIRFLRDTVQKYVWETFYPGQTRNGVLNHGIRPDVVKQEEPETEGKANG